MLANFCAWLGATSLSGVIQDVFWIIPTTQSIHIVSISIVMTSMAMLDLRLVGVAGRRQSIPAMADRFLPWAWVALVLLLCTGTILIIGEPARELQSQMFWIKMSLLAVVVVITAVFHVVLRRDRGFWDTHRGPAFLLGAVSLLIWVAIVGAGRWIAYAGHS